MEYGSLGEEGKSVYRSPAHGRCGSVSGRTHAVEKDTAREDC